MELFCAKSFETSARTDGGAQQSKTKKKKTITKLWPTPPFVPFHYATQMKGDPDHWQCQSETCREFTELPLFSSIIKLKANANKSMTITLTVMALKDR